MKNKHIQYETTRDREILCGKSSNDVGAGVSNGLSVASKVGAIFAASVIILIGMHFIVFICHGGLG